MTHVVLFDDGQADLGPLSDLRTSFEQRTGALTAVERWQRWGGLAGVATSAAPGSVEFAALQARMQRQGVAVNPTAVDAVWVSGRSHVTPGQAAKLPKGRPSTGADSTRADSAVAPPAWSRPWHLLDAQALARQLAEDIELIVESWKQPDHGALPSWVVRHGPAPLHIHASAAVGAHVVLDTSVGPILVDRGAQVRHGAVVHGPAYVGPGSVISEHTLIKSNTSIGPQCKVGGEIGSTIFQGCSNKVHDGHLGDSLVGEWVNMGAGTTNSNLLNTYAEVAMRLRPSGQLERTGRQFMGCLVGDHAKLAIGTRIMTGASIGTGTMWAATAPVSGAIGRFRWVTDGDDRPFQRQKFLAVARTVMERRSVVLGAAEEAALAQLMDKA